MPKIKITIPDPCHQSWQEMTPTEKGKFCDACQKCVVDFTAMTDTQIIDHITHAKGNICGRYKPSQLGRDLIASPVPKSGLHPRISTLLIGAGLIFGAQKATTQTPTTTSTDVAMQRLQQPQQSRKDSTPNSQTTKPNTGEGNYIEGTITDASNREALVGAPIRIKGTEIGTATDMDGKFKLTIPSSLINNTYTIVISYVGYASQEMVIDTKHFPQFLAVAMESGDFMGDVKIIVHKPSLYQRFLNIFRTKKNRR
jgi:CarboxypepD_reg-like domain